MQPMAKEFNNIETLQLGDVEDILETCYEVLDELWKLEAAVYPQQRMIHLMDIIAHAVTRYIQSKLALLELWLGKYNEVDSALNQGISLCEKWTDICSKLSSFYWPNYGLHRWQGGPYSPANSRDVATRLREVHSLRTLHKQLTQLLSHSEQDELRTTEAFSAFTNVNAVQFNPYTEPIWRGAIKQYENALGPAEHRIAGKLKNQLRNMNANTMQFMQEFKRYQELIRRPSIQRELVTERENLLGKISEYVETERKMFHDEEHGTRWNSDDFSRPVSNIYFTHHSEARFRDVIRTGDMILSDLTSWPALKADIESFLEEIKSFQRDQLDNWAASYTHDLDSGELSLRTDEQVIFFEQGKEMRVSYNRRLVTLTRDCRQLGVLGFPIPQKILKANTLAKKFAGQAMHLSRIANFHNTIGDRMIVSQRPMMLEAAVGLAQLVKEQTEMTWTDATAIEEYISKLQAHTDRLARQNNQLAAFHGQVREKVLLLLSTDLLRNQLRWKDVLKEIRQIIAQVEQAGFTNLRTWRAHWDRQLYKALEHQYQVGLEALNDHLPEISVELVYRQQQLQFRPPIEEIRMKYFTQLKRFLSIPNNFKGVGESQENLIFPVIVERNAHRFGHLFKKAEELFQKLERVKERFTDWVVLGGVDIEQMIEDTCRSSEDYERNFRNSKAKGQEIGRIPMAEEKINCLTVSFAPVRTEIEMLNRRFWDSLVTALQRSILNDITTIEKFAVDAMETLRAQPQSVEEIGLANLKHQEFEAQAPAMMAMFQDADKKNRVLAAWTREHVDQVARVTSIWDNFSSMMENHELVISKQVEAIKANLMTQVKNTNSEIEKFKMRWDQLKPKEDSMKGDQSKIIQGISFIKEKRTEWNELADMKAKIIDDCSHFGIKEPEFNQYDEVAKDLEKHEMMWGMFEEFNNEIEAMTGEEWIVFRSKMYKFEDFLSNWSKKLQSQEKATTVTVKLIQEVEKLKQILPVMKFVRGDIFSDHHWTEMYGMLGIPSKRIDHLVFGDFLKVKDRILAKETELQELNNRASGEVVIREALNELDVWEVEAKFLFAEHQATNGDKIPLIKEWRDVLNKVGDNQVLLQSIKGSSYYDAFGDRAVVWERKLTDLDEILHNLNVAQRKWVSLEPYQEQMKLKQNQTGGFNYREVFKRIDDDFRLIMGDAHRDNRVVAILRIGSVKSMLNSMLERLERCQKSLNDFLEEKRSGFPRFYFIGDEDLLQILGQASKPVVIQTHLKKLFAGIHSVNFDNEGKNIKTMNSLQGEVVQLKNAIRISSEVEAWMNDLSKEMKNTLRLLLVDCVNYSRKEDGSLDPLKYPSQILCLAESVIFAEKCEAAIKGGSLEKYLKLLENQLDSYNSVEFEAESESKVLELKLKALILDTIHHITIVKQLQQSKVRSVDHWLWQKQLRFYLDKNGQCKIRMVDAEFEYTYEYQGNASKLVHTELTDKCYLTLTQGMKMGLGGNPYGPAGTGKTESVKVGSNINMIFFIANLPLKSHINSYKSILIITR